MKVKILGVVVFFILNTIYNLAQVYEGSFQEIYFYRESSASTEATGKTFLFNSYDAFASSYNPSLPALSDNINASFTNSERLYSLENAYYHSFALNIPIKNIGVISASRRFYDLGEDINVVTLENPGSDGRSGRVTQTIYNINIAKKIYNDFYLGFGINYLNDEFIINNYDFYSTNIGLSYIHKFNTGNLKQKVFLGASVNNFFTYSSNNKIKMMTLPHNSNDNSEYEIQLPQISIWTLGYLFEYNGFSIIEDMKDIILNVQIEYLDVLNAKKYSRYNTGIELRLLEILIGRVGYYSIEYTDDKREDFTYGFGLNIPLHTFSTLPISIGVDYTNLEQEAGSPYFHLKNFNSITFSINYKL